MTSPPIDFGFTLDPAGYAGRVLLCERVNSCV
jgi:hypothetical protein